MRGTTSTEIPVRAGTKEGVKHGMRTSQEAAERDGGRYGKGFFLWSGCTAAWGGGGSSQHLAETLSFPTKPS